MSYYVGIDLGTTNSAICSYDGSKTQIRKSREQNDVTPSVIYFDRRGGKLIGRKAYEEAPIDPKSCAQLFKRYMGENTPIELIAVDRTLTPEECSSEILKELFGYLPEEIRKSEQTGTVVTVPAVFDMKRQNATLQAAEMAGIGKVELIQEPVSAVMSFMYQAPDTDGIFLIYDLGGGTFDVAIAQSTNKQVALLAHGGIEMCGGRDFDRIIVENIALPRLHDAYDLPNDLSQDEPFEKLLRIVSYSVEQTKIQLSRDEKSDIVIPSRDHLTEDLRDLKGNEIYLEIPLQRETVDELIADKVNDTINSARKTMTECGVNAHDLTSIVWIGGPTHYKPLRDKVISELGIKGDMSVNPMTAVAEGASIFAESIDWNTVDRGPKSPYGKISLEALELSFNYTARTPSNTSKIAVQVKGQVPPGAEFMVKSPDTAWESARMPLSHGTTVDVTLIQPGDNVFKVIVYDAVGELIAIEQDEIVITKTAATVEAIPCPHSIALVVLDKSSDTLKLKYLIRKNDPLPHTGTVKLKANEQLVAGTSNSLKFSLREGEFKDNIKANKYIGDFKIVGTDFEEGVIPIDADLICEYEIKTGEIKVEVSVPDISGSFEEVYTRTDAENNYVDKDKVNEIIENSIEVNTQIDEIRKVVTDERLNKAEQKLKLANTLDRDESDPEKVKEAEQGIKQAEELIEDVSRMNRKPISQIALTKELTFFDMYCRQHARASEETEFDKLVETAQRAIENNDADFDKHLNELKARIFEVLWRQPFFIIEQFKNIRKTMPVYASNPQITTLIHKGEQLFERDLIRRIEELLPEEKYKTAIIDDGTVEELREIVRQLMLIPRVVTARIDAKDVVNVFLAS
ncbi:Hsp70 family protein [Candidatus Poribacteria bacterium]|nr:Hsp70 family protein [Candidatus Poribacteria bacterium]